MRPSQPNEPFVTDQAVRDIVVLFGADRSRLMDIVIAVQHRFGYVSDDAIRAIASAVGIHAVEVNETASFYAFLDRKPRGRNRIRLSKTPVAFMKGAAAVAEAFEKSLGIAMGDTTADGAFTLEWTSDIGWADQEPAALVNGAVVTELTPADVAP
jgi:[NiFe] hydrogenase diaphorase moiety large subunit